MAVQWTSSRDRKTSVELQWSIGAIEPGWVSDVSRVRCYWVKFFFVYDISGTKARIYLEVSKMLCVLSAGGKMWKEDSLNRSAPGKSSKLLPLVALHGGPAWPHNYLLPLKHLVCHGISEVIFYDQAGCGDSQLPQDEDLSDFPHLLLAVKSFKLGYSHWRCFGMDTLLKICSVKCYLWHLGGKRRSPQRVFVLREIITCLSATGSNSTNPSEKSGNSSFFFLMRTDIWGWIRRIIRRKNFPLYWTIGSWILHFWEKPGWYVFVFYIKLQGCIKVPLLEWNLELMLWNYILKNIFLSFHGWLWLWHLIIGRRWLSKRVWRDPKIDHVTGEHRCLMMMMMMMMMMLLPSKTKASYCRWTCEKTRQ